VRSNDSAGTASLIKESVWSVDKDLPLDAVRTMAEVISESLAQTRFLAWLISAFAFSGLALTLVGIYGVVSYSANQRTQEMGIRMALGAQQWSVMGLILRQGIRLAVVGAAIGVGGSFLLTRLLSSQLYGIKPEDPATLAGVSVLMLVVALSASYFPARRATKVDPIAALRQE
jgi:ABC-type antimicrobial peptide transport system permease subunit